MDNLSTFFESIYKTNEWGNNSTPFFSGHGSHDSHLISPYVEVVKSFFKELSYKPNIIDIGCGDFNIGKNFVRYANNYLAIDIVDSLIRYNKEKYQDLNLSFKTLDITKEKIPSTDVIILKDVFQHLSNNHIISALQNIYLKSKYLIITESIPTYDFVPNLDTSPIPGIRPLFNNSGIDILFSPFNFPIEEEVLTLSIVEDILVGVNNQDSTPYKEKIIKKTSIYKTKYE